MNTPLVSFYQTISKLRIVNNWHIGLSIQNGIHLCRRRRTFEIQRTCSQIKQQAFRIDLTCHINVWWHIFEVAFGCLMICDIICEKMNCYWKWLETLRPNPIYHSVSPSSECRVVVSRTRVYVWLRKHSNETIREMKISLMCESCVIVFIKDWGMISLTEKVIAFKSKHLLFQKLEKKTQENNSTQRRWSELWRAPKKEVKQATRI